MSKPSLHVAYYRVSTDRQGASGLGLEAQQEAVRRHIGPGSELLAEFKEIESGKKHTNRPQLQAALQRCRKSKATLVIAKLDRLARNVHFITGLIESRVDFVCCDNPHANKAMLQMLAVFAEHEREQISQRTKAALAAAKARGTRLGNPRIEEARAARKNTGAYAKKTPPEILALMKSLHGEGKPLREIADKLNSLHVRTPRGSSWYASTVRNQLQAEAHVT